MPYCRKAAMLSTAGVEITVPLPTMLALSTHFLKGVGIKKEVAEWTSTSMTLGYFIVSIILAIMVDRSVSIFTGNLQSPPSQRCPHFHFPQYSCTHWLCDLCGFETPRRLHQIRLHRLHGHLRNDLWVSRFILEVSRGFGSIVRFLPAELTAQRFRSRTQAVAYSVNMVRTW